MRIAATDPGLYARLAEIALARAGAEVREPGILYDRHGVLVIRAGDVVVKAHQADRDGGPRLAARLEVAAALPRLLLAPLGPPLRVDGRVVTVWPYGEPVSPDDPPWEDAGRLLALLHQAPVPAGTPPWGRPARVARLVGELGGGPEADAVRAAFATLPAWIRGEAEQPPVREGRVVHGDWHLGQMVRSGGTWRLIDVEDLGVGDPAWDLARPAALYLAGVLHPDDWARFLVAYRAFGGPAAPEGDALWTGLDEPARILAIQIAATCVKSAQEANRRLDGAETALIDTCRRISSTGDLA
ncbi:phosphotransferase family protein [Spirillospora sp. CA-294931]|uniref:phosphotransferase family protein n=1 Tax=Spirillospora sp. CA-294931 TaxID=3240042 RepID=UPI003D941268